MGTKTLERLEQLERRRSENTLHRPIITHTIDSYRIYFSPSQMYVVCREYD